MDYKKHLLQLVSTIMQFVIISGCKENSSNPELISILIETSVIIIQGSAIWIFPLNWFCQIFVKLYEHI